MGSGPLAQPSFYQYNCTKDQGAAQLCQWIWGMNADADSAPLGRYGDNGNCLLWATDSSLPTSSGLATAAAGEPTRPNRNRTHPSRRRRGEQKSRERKGR